MSDKILVVRPPLVDNFIKIIHRLASRGRSDYQKHLINPLLRWDHKKSSDPLEQLLAAINKGETVKDKRLPQLYKLALVKSVEPDQLDLSIPGNVSINFLKSMKVNPHVISSDQALEFINLLKDPFKDYSDIEFKNLNKQFVDEITTADTNEVESLIKIREGEIQSTDIIHKMSKKAIHEIVALLKKNEITSARKHSIAYLIKFSDPTVPHQHTPIHQILDTISKVNKTFRKEVMDATAIAIYHEILKAIKVKNLQSAIINIAKYAVLFRGNPDTPNYYEVDSFEKKFIQIIEERNLWDSL